MVRVRAIFDEIFDPQGVGRVIWCVLSKKHFPAIFGSRVEFLCKTQDRESSNTFSRKHFTAIFGKQLDFLCKWKNILNRPR